MGATRESPSLTDAAELEELRRRAYGPDADIGNDPAAIARLIELESSRLPCAVSTLSVPLDAATAEMPPAVHAPEPRASLTHRGPGRRRRRRGVSVALAVAAVGCAAVGSFLVGGSSRITLYPRAENPSAVAAQLSTDEGLRYLGISPSDVRFYDDYRDLTVWSAYRGSDTICLFATSVAAARWAVDCAPVDGLPTVDLLQYREVSRLHDLDALRDVAEGDVLRLSLQDGAVTVRIVESPSLSASDP